jgi:hypothetical protein
MIIAAFECKLMKVGSLGKGIGGSGGLTDLMVWTHQ